MIFSYHLPLSQVWDLFAGGRLIHTFSNHQKTITTLFFNDENTRLFSGSLDRNLKVYDLKTYNVVHSSVYPSPILCAGLSKNSSHLVVGMADGLLSIRHRSTKVAEEEEEVRYSFLLLLFPFYSFFFLFFSSFAINHKISRPFSQ